MHDPELVFAELDLKQGDVFLDLGCGPGDYALHASSLVGESGVVYALDKWPRMIDRLTEAAEDRGLTNIKAMVTDITEPLPIEDESCDVCLLATVLHALSPARRGRAFFREIHRVLRPGGRVAIINCKKEEQPFGPPIHLRLSPQEMEDLMTTSGFERIGYVDLGYNYLIQFGLK